MTREKKPAVLILLIILSLLLTAARGENWRVAGENIPRFRELLDLLKASRDGAPEDRETAEAVLEEIRRASADDYDVGRAVADHWFGTVLNSDYPMFFHRGEERAAALEDSGLDFGGRHAFVVLGYQLKNGEMQEELIGRCEAAAAAARSFPESVLVCTGGVTGGNNPEKHSEAGEMKKYLTETCGIEESRIFTEAASKTTMENAVNTFRILNAQGIGAMTIVTSDYHQLWGQMLFNAMAAMNEKSTGHSVRIVGNYNYPAPEGAQSANGHRAGLGQLSSLLTREIDFGP